MFVEGYKQPDVVENQILFLIRIEELKPYIVEFDKDGAIKAKEYSVDCVMRGCECQPIVIITHDKCIFFSNNEI